MYLKLLSGLCSKWNIMIRKSEDSFTKADERGGKGLFGICILVGKAVEGMMIQALLPLCLLGVLLLTGFGAVTADSAHCHRIVKSWADEQMQDSDEKVEDDASKKFQLKELLFFLHIPRTGGRTYHQCFLRRMYTINKLCPRSYDKLRFDLSFPDCRLLSSHYDYSILARLPDQNTSVVTNLRHPFHRVLSTYEFSIEVAARFFKVANRATQIRQQKGTFRSTLTTPAPVSTLDIWPWKLLVPWMREDLFRRRSERVAGLMAIPNEDQNPYNISSVAMPLHEFIQHHQTFELVHNGATFQVAGLSNNSFHGNAQKIRSCVVKYPELGTHVLRVAKMHLNKMLYVGLTEKHEESARAFATIVGGQIFSQRMLNKHSSGLFWNGSQGHVSEDSVDYQDPNTTSASSLANSLKEPQDFVQKLLDSYHSCLKPLQDSQASRKMVSLKHIAPVKFSSKVLSVYFKQKCKFQSI
eukprot:c24962_g1_i2 orf=58-1461(+)